MYEVIPYCINSMIFIGSQEIFLTFGKSIYIDSTWMQSNSSNRLIISPERLGKIFSRIESRIETSQLHITNAAYLEPTRDCSVFESVYPDNLTAVTQDLHR